MFYECICTNLSLWTSNYLVLFGRCTAETLCRIKGGHAHSFPPIVVYLGKGCRRSSGPQLLLGLFNEAGLPVVFLEQLHRGNAVSLWSMRFRYEPYQKRWQINKF